MFESFLVREDLLRHIIANKDLQVQSLLRELKPHYFAHFCDGIFKIEELFKERELVVFQTTHVQSVINDLF